MTPEKLLTESATEKLLVDILERASACEDAGEFTLWVQGLEPQVKELLVKGGLRTAQAILTGTPSPPQQLSRAAAALRLDRAKLNTEQMKAADELYQSIYTTVGEGMERRGLEMQTGVRDQNVIAEVNLRLRREKWNTNWQPMRGKFDKTAITGWLLFMFPTDEAYLEAGDVGVQGAS